jgi:NADPH-dependent curcumin reductase CurA
MASPHEQRTHECIKAGPIQGVCIAVFHLITMAPITNGSAIFNEVPEGFPVLDKTIIYRAESIDLENVQLNGGILAKTLYLSIDPHLRRMMQDAPSTTGPAFQLDTP